MARSAARSCIALALVVPALAACAREPFPEPGHASPRRERDAAPAAPASARVWDRWSEAAGWPTASPSAVPARGHFGADHDVRIQVAPAAAPAYAALSPSTRMPAGAAFVARHLRRADGAPGATFAMVKREPGFHEAGANWEYLVLDADGRVVEAGHLPACARCHAEAPADRVYGLPRAAR